MQHLHSFVDAAAGTLESALLSEPLAIPKFDDGLRSTAIVARCLTSLAGRPHLPETRERLEHLASVLLSSGARIQALELARFEAQAESSEVTSLAPIIMLRRRAFRMASEIHEALRRATAQEETP